MSLGVDDLEEIVGPMDRAHKISSPRAVLDGALQHITTLRPTFEVHLRSYMEQHRTREHYFERCRGCDEVCRVV